MRRLLLFLLLGVGGALLVIDSSNAEVQEKCCFSHPSYSGTCEVTPGDGESCASVLRYLNTPNSQGKTYCGGTELRGGWNLASCGEASQLAEN
jgi:hypothetical protein